MNIFILFLCLFSLIFFAIFKYLRKSFKKKNFFRLNRKNLYKWMNLSKKERYKLSNNDSAFYLNERKNLLAQIRKEYRSIVRSDRARKF